MAMLSHNELIPWFPNSYLRTPLMWMLVRHELAFAWPNLGKKCSNSKSRILKHIRNYSVSPIYRGRVYRGIGYIAVACWTPFFWRPRARYFSRNRGNSLDPIRGRQFFAKSAHRDSLCSRFAGDNFSWNQLKPICQCGIEHMLCDGQPRQAEHWHLHCVVEWGPVNPLSM